VSHEMSEERLEALMVAVVDGVATPAEREALMRYLKDRPELAKELEEHMSIKAITDGWVRRLEADLVEDAQRTAPGNRGLLAAGTLLVVAGMAVLTGFGLAEVMMDAEAPTWIKVGFSLGTGGTLLLLLSVLRWKLATMKSDPYQEVIR
jgi:anti-sigma factor RsiW